MFKLMFFRYLFSLVLVMFVMVGCSTFTIADIFGLGDLGGDSQARGVSDDGSVVVGASQSPNTVGVFDREAFSWTNGTGMVGLGDLAGSKFHSFAFGVSGDGSVIVGQSRPTTGTEAFRWTSGSGMVGLGRP